jgi:hypothetical protein
VSSDSESESEKKSKFEDELDDLDLEEGSVKCLDPDTDRRSGCSGWNDTEPIASAGKGPILDHGHEKSAPISLDEPPCALNFNVGAISWTLSTYPRSFSVSASTTLS